MAKRKKDEGNVVPEWVVTYGDMMSLLLCFFILLAAFSELKQERDYQDVVRKVKEAFGYTGGVGTMPSDDRPDSSMENLLQEISEKVDRPRPPNDQNDPNMVGRELKVSAVMPGTYTPIGGTLPFQAGSAELTHSVKERLVKSVIPSLRDQRYIFEVRGHAWGVEDMKGGDLFDLSFARARSVVDFLISEGGIDRKILRPVSIGDGEPAQVGGLDSDAGAANRRVQVMRTEITVDDVHPDPYGTGR